MSQRIGNITLIAPEDPRECELCGKFDECRPYGPNGEQVCYECAMKDEAGTTTRMKKILFGDNETQ